MSKKYFHAIATLMGTIIGVGIFSIPYVAYQSGMLLFVVFLLALGSVQFFMHLIYAEIFLSTKKRHRVPGYVKEYFGKRFKKPALLVVLTSTNLSMLSYLIIGGLFMHELLSPAFGGTIFIYTFLMFLLTGLLTYKGIKFIAKTELLLSAFLFVVIGIIAFKGFPIINAGNYSTVVWKNVFLPYGPIFMGIGGMTAIPTVCTLLAHKKSNIKSAIFWGTFIPIILTLIFVFTIVGISGSGTSPDALAGLHGRLGSGVVLIALVFGLISVFTSFMMFVEATKEVYWWDLGVKKKNAWSLAMIVPFSLFLLGINNLTTVVTLAGAIIGGVLGVIYILLILKVKQNPQKRSYIQVRVTRKAGAFLATLFLFGFMTVFQYVNLRTILVLGFVLFFYLYSLIRSDHHNTTIYYELWQTSKKAGTVFAFVFFLALAFGVFAVIV